MPDNPIPKPTVQSKLARAWDEFFWRVDNLIDSTVVAAFLLGVIIGTWIA